MRVLRGYSPQEPQTFTQRAPVAAGVVIYSGQVISLQWNGTLGQNEWILGGGDGSNPAYFALQDSVEEDVIAGDSLVGLSCAGRFELKTGYYKDGDTFIAGTPVTFDGVTGNVKAATAGVDPIMGYVSRIHGTVNAGVSQVENLGPTFDDPTNPHPGQDSSATNLNVITLTTTWTPHAP